RPVDPLEALRDRRADAEQQRSLRRPVARRPRAVLLARDDDEWHALGPVALRRVEDRRFLTGREVTRPVALPLDKLVAQPDVAERASCHHLMVATPRAEAVEVEPVDSVRV